MNGFAQVSICGTLGADAEIRSTGGGKTVCKMRVAVTRTWKDGSGNRQEETLWLTCQDWANRPQFIRDALVKGTPVAIQGSLREESWDKDGQKHYRIVVNVDMLEVFSKRTRNDQPSDSRPASNDDIPW